MTFVVAVAGAVITVVLAVFFMRNH